MRRFAAFLLAAVLLAATFPLAAAAQPRLIGDLNGDALVNAKDTTFLRRYLAGGYGVKTNFGAADVNADTVISAKDVTVLRRALAGGYGVTLGTYVPEPALRFHGSITGGELYEDLDAPDFGADGYTFIYSADGVTRSRAFAASVAAKIAAGNTEEITLDDAYTEVERDEIEKTITLRTQAAFSDGSVYREETISFTGGENYRILGRAFQDTDGVVCDWSADGVEFTLDCKGSALLTADASILQGTTLKYRVIVDGVPSEQVNFRTGGEETLPVELARIRPGVHTIRIIKDTQISASRDVLKSITLLCKADTMHATEPKARMLEVIGDSTTAGYGAVVTDTPETTKNSSSIMLSYGYLVAEGLGMDWQMCVKGSLGVLKKTGSPAYNYADLYEYQNRWRDPETRFPFTRKADVVLIKVSGNDGSSIPNEDWKLAMTNFIATIRSYHGEDTPIVFFGQKTQIKKPVAEEIIQELPGCYGVFIRGDDKGMGGHASAAGQARFAAETITAMRPIVESLN